MRIVIDIPDWRYKSICKGIEATKRCGVVGPDPVIHEAIYKGIPLPKGHGRLIDADDINNHIIGCVDTRDCPTIIDKDGD